MSKFVIVTGASRGIGLEVVWGKKDCFVGSYVYVCMYVCMYVCESVCESECECVK